MLTVLSFMAALGLLIAVHEYGHYWMARVCGVKVLRFSIGFGKVLLRWQPKGSATEFVIAAFPLGGYVKMLDEREAPVAVAERHLAFNTQPLRSRAAIVAAGPLANLLLAVLLYSLVNWGGVEQARAVLASPPADSVAAQAGVRGGELVERAAIEGETLEPVVSFEDLRWLLTQAALNRQIVRLEVSAAGRSQAELTLDLTSLEEVDADAQLFRKIGILAPYSRPVLGKVMSGGPAEKAGLREGDLVLRTGPSPVVDAQQLRNWIRASVHGVEAGKQNWDVVRDGQNLSVTVEPEVVGQGEASYGRIAAYVGGVPEFVTVRYGPLDGLWTGMTRTWDVSMLTLRMMGKMLIGEASLKNLSGPLTIADYAGKSASMGVSQYLVFLALISVSLGVLNLLPLPVLDGGHLMYYLWEGLTGRSVSDVWMDRMQRGGVAVLLLMMSIAIFNDLTRLFG